MEAYGLVHNNLGPDYAGAYQNDYNILFDLSGINSVSYWDNPNDTIQANVCTYYVTSYRQTQALIHTNGSYNLPYSAGTLYGYSRYDISSFKWTSTSNVIYC
jgi:hypothetical protein